MKKRLKQADQLKIVSISSGCSGRSVLLVALAAVNRPGSVRLEGNLGLLATFGASYICHFSRTTIVAATAAATTVFVFSLKHLIHLPFVSIQRTESSLQKTSQQISLNRRKCNLFPSINREYISVGQNGEESATSSPALIHTFSKPVLRYCYISLASDRQLHARQSLAQLCFSRLGKTAYWKDHRRYVR